MKKTIDINLCGHVYHIEEEAYDLLRDYMEDLKEAFKNDEDKETISDIEARIAELFSERLTRSKNVVDVDDVKSVLSQLGSPKQFTAENGEPHNAEPIGEPQDKRRRRFYRNPDDKIIAGVCSGIAAHFGWDPIWLRLAFLALIFFPHFPMVLVYIILWIIMPEAKTVAQKVEMNGQNPTVETIKENRPATPQNDGFSRVLRGIVKVFAWIVLGLVILITIPVCFAIIAALIASLVGIVAFGAATYAGLTVALCGIVFLPVIAAIVLIVNLIRHRAQPKWYFWVGILLLWLASIGGFVGSVAKNQGNLSNVFSGKMLGSFVGVEDGDYAVVPVEEFAKIEVQGVVALQIEQGDEQSVLAEDNVKVSYDRGVLCLKGIGVGSKANHVKVVLKNLEKLEIEGVASVKAKDLICNDIDLDIEGVASLDIDGITAATVKLNVEGTSTVKIVGTADRVVYDIEGLTSVDCRELVAKDVQADCEGASSVYVYADRSAYIETDGTTKVTVYGSAPDYKAISSGLSKIVRK